MSRLKAEPHRDEERQPQDEGPILRELAGPVGDDAPVEGEDGGRDERGDAGEVRFEPAGELEIPALDGPRHLGEMTDDRVQGQIPHGTFCGFYTIFVGAARRRAPARGERRALRKSARRR